VVLSPVQGQLFINFTGKCKMQWRKCALWAC